MRKPTTIIADWLEQTVEDNDTLTITRHKTPKATWEITLKTADGYYHGEGASAQAAMDDIETTLALGKATV